MFCIVFVQIGNDDQLDLVVHPKIKSQTAYRLTS